MTMIKNVHGNTLDWLGEAILTGHYPVGSSLPPEPILCEELGVSRTVVREAVSRLKSLGLVDSRHGIGTFALEAPTTHNFRIAEQDMATVDDVIAVLELRISLETEAAGLAAQRATPEQLTAMAAALHGFSMAIHSHSDAVPSDFQFHMEIAKATGNRHFAELMTYLGAQVGLDVLRDLADQAPEGRQAYLERVHGEHESIFNAIRNHDTEAARAAMRTHLSNSRDRLRKARNSAA